MAILEDYPSTNTPLNASTLFNAMYPVGCIYQTTDGTFNPNTGFGIGTWVQIKDVFLLSAGDTYSGGSTGGDANHTHTISHTHTLESAYAQFSMGNSELRQKEISTSQWTQNLTKPVSGNTSSTSSARTYGTALGGTTDSPGTANSGSASNLPPYQVVYTWNRTA